VVEGVAVGAVLGAADRSRTEAVNAGPVVRTKQTTDRYARVDEVTSRASGPSFGRFADAAVQEATDGYR